MVIGYPFMAFIDPCNACNYHCPLCPTGIGSTNRKKKIMSLEDFKKIMDMIGPYLYSLYLYNWGEPLLNKDIIPMIRYAKEKTIMVFLSTNLALLDENLAKGIFESGLDHLYISFDGMSPETYGKYRVGGDVEHVKRNIDLLVGTRDGLGAKKPAIHLQFIVNKYNEHEVDEARAFAHEKGLGFCPGSLVLDLEDHMTKGLKDIEHLKHWLPSDPEYSLYDEDLNIKIADYCDWPWTRICINPDGTVSPCCSIYSDKFDFGNILTEGFHSVWNGKKYRLARKVIREERASSTKNMICDHCIKNNGYILFQPCILGY